MTNDDLKQELDTIHFALNDLKNLCSKKGIKAVHLDGFVHLIEQKYSDLHENLVSTLNTYCSGSMKPDTDLGGNVATLGEVFNGKTTSFVFNRI